MIQPDEPARPAPETEPSSDRPVVLDAPPDQRDAIEPTPEPVVDDGTSEDAANEDTASEDAANEDAASEDAASEDDAYWRTLVFTPGIQAFAEYRLELYDEASSTEYFHEFDVPRVWVWTAVALGDVRARVLLEGTRAGGAGSLVGVGGDSVVVRFREAWLGYRAWDLFELRAGIVPTMTAPALTNAWGARYISQTGLRRFEIMAPADLGVNLTFDIPERFGRIGAGFYNGEGYTSRELNRGKNTELFAEIHPLAFVPELQPLTLMAAYQIGSSGTGLARSDRLFGALAWNQPEIGGGFAATWVMGYEDRGSQEGALIEAWARGNPWEGLMLTGRVSHFLRDLTVQDDTLTELTFSVGYRLFDVVGAHVAVDGRFAGAAAAAAIPGYEEWRIRVIAEGSFEHPIPWVL